MINKHAKIIHIYSLSHPITKEVFYIGQTSNMSDRFIEHCANKEGDKGAFIQELIRQGLKPIMTELEVCPWYFGAMRENFYIMKYRELGCSILNKVSLSPFAQIKIEVESDLRGFVYEQSHKENIPVGMVVNKILREYFKDYIPETSVNYSYPFLCGVDNCKILGKQYNGTYYCDFHAVQLGLINQKN